MSGIRGKDTKPELLIRRALHAKGFRYRLHSRNVPGSPDLVLPKFRAAVFINGCFWHGHDCPLFRLPGTRTEFWQAKIERNRMRDKEVAAMLSQSDWRRLVVWECVLKGRGKLPFETVVHQIIDWLEGSVDTFETKGLL